MGLQRIDREIIDTNELIKIGRKRETERETDRRRESNPKSSNS